MVEMKGPVGAIETVGTTVKPINVSLVGYKKIGFGLVIAMVCGDVDTARAVMDAGACSAEKAGKIVTQHVILKPRADVEKILPHVA